MWEKTLERMRRLVRAGKMQLTRHADREMANDRLTLGDVTNAILLGRITKRQRDQAAENWKFVVAGPGLAGQHLEVAAKIGFDGRLLVITVYRVR